MPARGAHICPNCGERVTMFAAGCALCGAALDPRRAQGPPTLGQRLRSALTRGLRTPALHAVAAALGAAALLWLAPPGADLAAHVYQRSLFVQHGFVLWNNFWYAGRYSFVTYSLLYYPLAALVGIKALAVLSAAAAAGAFVLLVQREWPSVGPAPAATFTLVSAASVLTGAFPYALGLAAALLALVALGARALGRFSLLVVLTFAASPLAFVLLAVVLTGIGAARSWRGRGRPVLAVMATGVAGGLLWRAFPATGSFPFSAPELTASLVFSGLGLILTWRIKRARILSFVFGVYGLACLLAFAVPSGLGENIARLRFIAIPLAVLTLSLRHWRPLLPALATLALAASWNFTPLAYSVARSAADPSARPSYWRPALGFLHGSLGRSYRVEAVDTSGHWEAVYLPRAGIPIARGWFRQDDFPQNRILYSPFARSAYLTWLRGLGVEYVVSTDAPPDYSSVSEAALLRSGHSGLRAVFRSAHSVVYAVPAPVGIVTGPGRPLVTRLGAASVALELTRPGRFRLSLRYSPYWTSSEVCVAPRADGMIEIRSERARTVHLRFDVTAAHALATLAGVTPSCA